MRKRNLDYIYNSNTYYPIHKYLNYNTKKQNNNIGGNQNSLSQLLFSQLL
jgi:hypothetical protein